MKLKAALVLQKTPLTIKVVSLYVAVLLPLFLVFGQMPANGQAEDTTNQYLNQLLAIEDLQSLPPETISGVPNRLTIPRLGVNLPVTDGYYNKQSATWTLENTGVHYAVMTSQVNTSRGNTLLYGHNNNKILGPTRNIRKGDILRVTTEDNKVFTYRFAGDIQVTPNDTDIFKVNPDKPRLTLLTCEGLWNEKRRLMRFEFVEVSWNS